VKRNAPLDVYTDFTHFINFKGTVVMHKLLYILSFLAKTILQQKPITSF